MIYKDREWHVTDRVYYEDKSYSPQRASKFLMRSRLDKYDKPSYYGTVLSVQETLNRDYPYRLMVYSGFDKKLIPQFPNINIPITCNKGDIESACNIADDIYRGICTEFVKFFTEDCKMLPEI